jgi:hypothetical protein
MTSTLTVGIPEGDDLGTRLINAVARRVRLGLAWLVFRLAFWLSFALVAIALVEGSVCTCMRNELQS